MKSHLHIPLPLEQLNSYKMEALRQNLTLRKWVADTLDEAVKQGKNTPQNVVTPSPFWDAPPTPNNFSPDSQ